jgi:hypothetical protein
MKPILALLLLSINVWSVNAMANCRMDDAGITRVIVNDMLGYVVEKNAIMARVLKEDDLEDYNQFVLTNPYSEPLRKLTLLNEVQKEQILDVHLEESIKGIKQLMLRCSEADLKAQLNFLVDNNYAKYREAMQGKNPQVETALDAVLREVTSAQ